MKTYLYSALRAAVAAGKEILDVYSRPVKVEFKEDRSPLTEADRRAHVCIVNELAVTGLPVLSEEGKSIAYNERAGWKLFWMVDPLDGTKEFIKRNGEFTVNIALIENGNPVAGVVYAPVTNILYFNFPGDTSYRIEAGAEKLTELLSEANIHSFTNFCSRLPYTKTDVRTVVASRSHLSEETAAFIDEQRAEFGELNMVSKGSSLKLCLVAEGSADIYPRFAPTMEWDTAAGHAVVTGAGKNVYQAGTNDPLKYNKENLLNPWFVVK